MLENKELTEIEALKAKFKKEVESVLKAAKEREGAGLPIAMLYKELVFSIECLNDNTVSEGRK